MTGWNKLKIVTAATIIWLTASTSAICGTVETAHLLVSAAPSDVSEAKLEALAGKAEQTLADVVKFWSIDPRLERFGKIRVVFDAPRRNGYTSVFFWRQEGGRRFRTVLVLGFEEPPQMLAHKLSSAIFMQRDKMIRNMLGILTEINLGNPATFPMCGFDVDDWAGLFLSTGTAIALEELGPSDESWGMAEGGDGRIIVLNRQRQHKAYAEAGSFAAYLERRYGKDKLKALNRAALDGSGRSWRAIFGEDLTQLEAAWRTEVATRWAGRPNQAGTLATLVATDPATACTAARQLAPTTNPTR